MASFGKQEEMDPSFNLVELRHFFKLEQKDKNNLLELLPYFKCERTDIETVADIIVETAKRRNSVSGNYVVNVFSAQATVQGQWKKLIPIVRRIYDEGNDYSKGAVAVWATQEMLSTLHLAGSEDKDEVFEFYKMIVQSAIEETKGRFTMSAGQYKFPILYEFYQRKLEVYNARDAELIAKYVDRAIEHKDEDRDFVSWMVNTTLSFTDVILDSHFP